MRTQKKSIWQIPYLSIRFLGFIHCIVAYSSWCQFSGLIGSHGIRPWAEQATLILQKVAPHSPWLKMPTLLWLTDHSDSALHLIHGLWFSSALILLLGLLSPLMCFIGYLCSLSLSQIQAPFLPFQWDLLLHECTLLAMIYTPWTWALPYMSTKSLKIDSYIHNISRWSLRLLLFKLMLDSGIAKLISQDPQWKNLHALHFHFWTQPLPHIGAVWAHSLPHMFKQIAVSMTLAIEVWVPFLLFFRVSLYTPLYLSMAILLYISGGMITWTNSLVMMIIVLGLDDRIQKRIAFPFKHPIYGSPVAQYLLKRGDFRWISLAPIGLLMLLISATGNYGFFQLLVVFLIWTQLDIVHPFTAASADSEAKTQSLDKFSKFIMRSAVSSMLILWCVYNILLHVPWLPKKEIQQAIRSEKQVTGQGGFLYDTYWLYHKSRQYIAPWQVSTRYGLFARMTTKRTELLIEASQDAKTWYTYPFKYKPNHASDVPSWTIFHMPRLDWYMWFEAMHAQCSHNWFLDFLEALLKHKKDVLDLLDLERIQVSDAQSFKVLSQPQWIRVRKVKFDGSSHGLWREKNLDFYCPVVNLQQLQQGRRELR